MAQDPTVDIKPTSKTEEADAQATPAVQPASIPALGSDHARMVPAKDYWDEYFKDPWKLWLLLPIIYVKWGIWVMVTVVIAFVLGLFTGYLGVYEGYAPEFVVKRYKGERAVSPDQSPPEPLKPPSGMLTGNVMESPPEFIQNYVYRLEHEGLSTKQSEPGVHVAVQPVEFPMQQPAAKFFLLLEQNDGYEVTCRAFKISKEGSINPLKFVVRGTLTEFMVPECEGGDRLVVVVRAVWRHETPLNDIQTTYRLSVQ